MINAFLKDIDKHIIAESTNLGGTKYAKHIVNVKASEDIDNGKLVNLTEAKYEKNEYFTMVEPTTACRVGLILSVAIGADEQPRKATLESNFYNGKGEIMRVYDLMDLDRFTVSANGITALAEAPVVGNYVVADGYDIKEVSKDSAPFATNGFVGEIIEKIVRTGGVFYKILVRQNKEV